MVDPVLGEQHRCPDDDLPTLDLASHTPTGFRLEARGRLERQPAPFGFLDDGGRQRMLTRTLQPRRETHDQILVIGDRLDRADTRLTFRQRAGLVDDQRVDALKGLERVGVSD